MNDRDIRGSHLRLPHVVIFTPFLCFEPLNPPEVMSEIDTIQAFSLLFAEIYCRNGENVL